MRNKNAKIVPFVGKLREYPNYSDREYWRLRYDNIDGPYDWYDEYETISPLINHLNLNKRSTILHVGIGNSEFSEKLYDDGYKRQYNIDYSRNVIHYMKQRNKKLRSSMVFETMNVLDLDYEDGEFDIVFDKAVFDCVLCGLDADAKATTFISEIYRVLKPKGFYFLVSNSEPGKRMKYLQNDKIKYDVEVHSIINDKEQSKMYEDNDRELNFMKKTHYIYVCQKMEEDVNNEKMLIDAIDDKNKKEEEEKEVEIKENVPSIKEEEDKKTQKTKSKSNKSKNSKKKSNKSKSKDN